MKKYGVAACPFGYEIFEVGNESVALVNDLEFAEKICDLLNAHAEQADDTSSKT